MVGDEAGAMDGGSPGLDPRTAPKNEVDFFRRVNLRYLWSVCKKITVCHELEVEEEAEGKRPRTSG